MASITQILNSAYHSARLIAFRGIRSSSITFSTRRYSQDYKPQEDNEALVVDDMEGTVGVERWELLQRVKGIDDPFQLTAKTVTAGTKDKPTLIPTISNQRTVGCICEKDSPIIKWMRLGVGETKRCECGHWFKLVPLEE